jgi:hypothetical protein
MMFFWVLASCRLVGRCRHFGETYFLHLKAVSISALSQPRRWRQYASPKRWHLPMSLHGAKTQNNIIILTAVKTSNRISTCIPKGSLQQCDHCLHRLLPLLIEYRIFLLRHDVTVAAVNSDIPLPLNYRIPRWFERH